MRTQSGRANGIGLSQVVAGGVAAAALAAAVLMALAPGQFWSPPRLVIYGLLPAAIGLVGLGILVFRRGAATLYTIYVIAFGAALVLAEMMLDESPAATAPPTDPARVPQICRSMLPAPLPGSEGRPLLPLGGIARAAVANDPPHHLDEHGFNNPTGLWAAAPIQVLAVGDSFTYGADVPYGVGFVDRLRDVYPATVNLGCGGNGPLAELGALVEYGPVLRPRLVLWVLYEGNDLTKDLQEEAALPLLAGYLNPGTTQALVERQGEIDAALRAFLAARVQSEPGPLPAIAVAQDWRGLLTLGNLRTRLGLRHAVRPEALSLFERTLARAKDVARAWDGRLVLVYLPAETRYATVLGRWDARAYAARARDSAARLGIPVIDLAATLDAQRDPRRLYRGHFTTEGYALVAAVIRAQLVPLLPPSGR